MQTSAPDHTQLKSAMKAAWMAGDFGHIANFTAREAEKFVGRIGLAPGSMVLDVACGTGNTSIPAARAGDFSMLRLPKAISMNGPIGSLIPLKKPRPTYKVC